MTRGIILILFLLYTSFTPALADDLVKNERTNSPSVSFSMKQSNELPSFSTLFFALLLCVVITLLALYLLKKYHYRLSKFSRKTSSIELIESKRIGMTLNIHLIKIENKKYILAEKGDRVEIVEQKDMT